MTDPRYTKLSDVLVGYSTELKKNDRVLLDMIDVPDEFAIELMRAVRKAGAIPLMEMRHTRVTREIMRGTTPAHAALVREVELFRMKQVQAYIAVRGRTTPAKPPTCPGDRMALYAKAMRPVLDYRVNKTRWCVLRWPSPSMAQAANMSTEAFEDFYFDVCTMNYPKMARAMVPLQKRMNKRRPGPSQRPRHGPAFQHQGHRRAAGRGQTQHSRRRGVFLPGQEFGARASSPTTRRRIYSGTKFENVRLEFKDGKIIKATANNSKRLNEILDTDAGARYVGEFSLGFNPYILNPMCDILFDEKIAGSLHFTPGQAYEEADNGNRSAVHWDMVLIQRPEWGGGEVWFDGELIRKNGLFLPRDLQPLNPVNFK